VSHAGQTGTRRLPGSVLLMCAALLTIGGAVGCSGLLHSSATPTQVYLLRAAPPRTDPPRGAASASLHVGRPIAGPGLNSDHIVLVQSDHRMSYYLSSRWPADLPEVIEALTVETLRASGSWTAVQDSSSAFPSDYLLHIVIRRFEADYSGNPAAPEVHVSFDCTIGKRAGREVMASFVAEGTASASANRLGDVVSAFEIAANKALDSVAARTSQVVGAMAETQPLRHE
jgi:cholesterol transport system auxiliary component